MLRSMTGYGKINVLYKDRPLKIEVKSINSKQLDLLLRIPALFKEKEQEIRNMVSTISERGKIELTITFEQNSTNEPYVFNQSLAELYYKQLEQFAQKIGAQKTDILSTIITLPDIFSIFTEELSDEEWKIITDGIAEALGKMNECRLNEGIVLKEDIEMHVQNIINFLQKIKSFEDERIEIIRDKIFSMSKDMEKNVQFDKNRFEQEIIYYMEKLDFTEEKIRLAKHCSYFKETMQETGSIGRKLSFIAQEMGREINTLGSKANHFEIQRLVVLMKDELEKIKEQLLNIL